MATTAEHPGLVAHPSEEDPSRTRSFSAATAEGVADGVEFFAEHGFVVFQVLPAETVEATVDEVWDVAIEGQAPDVERDDPSTWGDEFWPVDDNRRGFLDGVNPWRVHQAWGNRQNPTIVAVFRALLKRDELLVRAGRYGVMRPTESPSGRPEWATTLDLHWDHNPWREGPAFRRLQGLLTLSPHTLTSGGFECVPGFAHRMEAWAAANPRGCAKEESDGGLVVVPPDDHMHAEARRVTAAAGSLIVWDSRTPHRSYSNASAGFRVVQYITYYPAEGDAEDQAALGDRIREQLRLSSFTFGFPELLTPLGRKLVGLQPWLAPDGSRVPDDE